MIRGVTIAVIVLLTIAAGAFAQEPVVFSFSSDADISPWDVTYHKPDDDFEMNHGLALVAAEDLAPLGVSHALQFTFDLRSAWASVETGVDLEGQDVNEVILYLRVNEGTRVLMMEAYEDSGARWRAMIRLRPDMWNEIILTPLDFFYLLGGDNRGGPEDLVILSELNRIGFTVDGHEIGSGAKEIQIGFIAIQ